MYKPRFRNRNAYVNFGNRVIDTFTSTSCTVGPAWYTTALGSSGAVCTTIDTMDDIAGDPPDRRAGLAGYRFHPMTKVKAEEHPGAPTAWQTRQVGSVCYGTPYEHAYQTRRNPTGDTHRRQCGLALPLLGDRLDLTMVPFPHVRLAQLRDLAETACLSKRGKLGESNLYESFAEVDKSVGMLKDIFDRVRRIQETAFFGKKGSSRLRTFSNEAAGQYLATRYGFIPLVKDVFSILEGLKAPLGKRLQTSRSRQKSNEQQNLILPTFSDSGHVLFSGTHSIAHVMEVEAMSLDSVDVTLMGALGLGYKDLFGLPYELVTLSFVADWFANIGDFLSSLAPDIGFSNVGSCITTKWNCTELVVYSAVGADGADKALVGAQGPSYARTIEYTERVVRPLASRLQWQSDFKFDRAIRSLDALALLSAQFSRVKSRLPKSVTSRDKLQGSQRRGVYFSNAGTRDAWDFRGLSD